MNKTILCSCVLLDDINGSSGLWVGLMFLLRCVLNLWVLSWDRQAVSVTVHQAQFLSSRSKAKCHLPSAFHPQKRKVHLADISSDDKPVPIQTRTCETHLVTQICICVFQLKQSKSKSFFSFCLTISTQLYSPSDKTPYSSAAQGKQSHAAIKWTTKGN